MFKEATVFILGAGASWHYGYPTGEDLVKKVIEKASIAERFFEHGYRSMLGDRPNCLEGEDIATGWKKGWEQCVKLKAGLEQVKPLVIDYYLGWNPDLQNIGRLLIAWVILECEHRSQFTANNINRDTTAPDDWCRFIIHQIAIHCRQSNDLLLNKVSFVTFNYDVSLEDKLRNGLRHIQMFSETDVAKFLGGSRIVHIYGNIRDDLAAQRLQVDWNAQNQTPEQFDQLGIGDYHVKMKTLLDAAYNASKGLRVIDPHDKGADDTEIMMARTAIANAQRVFILGYGFDEHNSERLNLRETLRHATELAKPKDRFRKASKLLYRPTFRRWPG